MVNNLAVLVKVILNNTIIKCSSNITKSIKNIHKIYEYNIYTISLFWIIMNMNMIICPPIFNDLNTHFCFNIY